MMLEELKTTPKLVGLKQSVRALEDGSAVKAFVAEDAAPDLAHKLDALCRRAGVEVVPVPSMKELGSACGIDVGASVVVLTRQK